MKSWISNNRKIICFKTVLKTNFYTNGIYYRAIRQKTK